MNFLFEEKLKYFNNWQESCKCKIYWLVISQGEAFVFTCFFLCNNSSFILVTDISKTWLLDGSITPEAISMHV